MLWKSLTFQKIKSLTFDFANNRCPEKLGNAYTMIHN